MKISKISRSSVFYSLFAISVSNAILQALGFVYRIFLSRMTGAEGLGVYQLVMPFYSVASSLTLTGLTVAVARISASRAGVRDYVGARHSVNLARYVFIVSVAIIAFFTLSFRDTVAETFLGDIRTAEALPFVFICLFLTGLENILKNYFYGVGRVAPQITSELSEQIIRILAVAILLMTFRTEDPGKAAALIVAGMVVSELFSSSLLTLFYQPEKRRLSAHAAKPPRVRELLSISVPVSAAATVNNLLTSFNSILIPQRLRVAGMSAKAATEAFGVMFGMTMPLLSCPIAFMAALTSVMVPKLSEVNAAGNMSDMRRKAGKTIHATGLLSMPCFALLIPLGEPLCRVLFAHEAAGNYMLPLCIATLFAYYEMTTGALLNGIGMQRQAAIYIVIGGVLQIMFTWLVGFPHIGMRGFVIGYIASAGVTALLNILCLKKKLRLRLRFSNWFLTPLLSSTLACLICDIVYNFLLARAVTLSLSLIFAAIAGLAAYSLALSALGTNIIRYIKTLIPNNY